MRTIKKIVYLYRLYKGEINPPEWEQYNSITLFITPTNFPFMWEDEWGVGIFLRIMRKKYGLDVGAYLF